MLGEAARRGGVPRSMAPELDIDDWTVIGGLPRPPPLVTTPPAAAAAAAAAEKAPERDKAGF